MPPIPVADFQDPRLALYRGVRDPELLRAHGVFMAEGRLVVERLLAHAHYRARSVLVTPAAHGSLAGIFETAGCPVYLVSPSVMRQVTGFDLHRGCLAIGERGEPTAVARLASTAGPLICLEAVGNPDNIGGVFRNAAAFGASGVILSAGCSDPLYRKSIRTSMGGTFIVPFAVAEEWPAAIAHLRAQGWTVLALTPAEDAGEIHDIIAALKSARIALLLGHEGVGLTTEAQALASVRARIRITSAVESLNVAVAAAIGLYEITVA